MKYLTLIQKTILTITLAVLFTACSDGGGSGGIQSASSTKQTSPEAVSKEQLKATQIATEFVTAMKERVRRVNNSPFSDAEQTEYQDKWVTPVTKVYRPFGTYLAAAAFKYKNKDEQIDGLGLAQISNTIGNITYRFGVDECELLLIKTGRGWRITATSCSNHVLRGNRQP